MALSISRKLWRRGRPSFSGVGSNPSMHSHSVSKRSVKYGLLIHARVAASTLDYPFSDSFPKPSEKPRGVYGVALGTAQQAPVDLRSAAKSTLGALLVRSSAFCSS